MFLLVRKLGLDGTFSISVLAPDLITRPQKVEIDSFSGYRIYPSKGKLFVRGDSKVRAPKRGLISN